MDLQKDIFTLNYSLTPKFTLGSFGANVSISPDGNTIVVIDKESSFIYFYNRTSANNISPYRLVAQFTKPEFKFQYILSDIVFSDDSTQCFISVKYCDYVNYDIDIKRNNYLISGMLYIRQQFTKQKIIENIIYSELDYIWTHLFNLPYNNDVNGYDVIDYNIDLGIYGATKESGNGIKIFRQPTDKIKTAISNQTSNFLTIDVPIRTSEIINCPLNVLDNVKKLRFVVDGISNKKDYVVIQSILDNNISRREIINISNTLSLGPEIPFLRNVNDFEVDSQNYQVACYSPNLISVYDILTTQLIYTVGTDISDSEAKIYYNKDIIVLYSNIDNKLRIYSSNTFAYIDNYSYSSACLDNMGTTMVIGQPKGGKVLIFYSNENIWNLFQTLSQDGYTSNFDIDGSENTLMVINKNNRTTEIYENITDDLSMLVDVSQISVPKSVTTRYSDYYIKYMAVGFNNIIVDKIPVSSSPTPISGNLFTEIPYYITYDGNIIISIYESVINYKYVYHLYGNKIKNDNTIDSTFYFQILSQSSTGRLKSISSDRRGDVIVMLFADNSVDFYRKVNYDEQNERYVLIQPRNSNFTDVWRNIIYNSTESIQSIKFNLRGNILFVQHGANVIVLHYGQEILFYQKLVGNPSTGTEPSFSYIPSTVISTDGLTYNYYQNYYVLFSQPVASYIYGETLIHVDKEDNLYTWNNNQLIIYKEDNLYRNKIKTITFPQTLLPSKITFNPQDKLFTYYDNTNIYIYYYDDKNYQLLDTNIKLPVGESYKIIDKNIIVYDNRNLKIYEYNFDVILNQNYLDFSYNIICTKNFPNLSDIFMGINTDTRNNIILAFRNTNENNFYRFVPTSEKRRNFKHMITFYEQKIDIDVQYKFDEFYNNVNKILPSSYVKPNIDPREENSTETSQTTENENNFHIYCPQVFTYEYERGTSDNQNVRPIHLEPNIRSYDLNLESPISYDNKIIVSKYFDPNQYTTLGSVLRYMNQINDNRTQPLYEIKFKRHVGIIAKMNKTNSLQPFIYKYELQDNGQYRKLIEAGTLIDEKMSSVGNRLSVGYSSNSLPDYPGNFNGIYLSSDDKNISDPVEIRFSIIPTIPIEQIRFDIIEPKISDTKDNDRTPNCTRTPTSIKIYVITELIVDVITPENLFSFFGKTNIVTNTEEFGNLSKISKKGNTICVNSNLETQASIPPPIPKYVVNQPIKYDIWIEQSYFENEQEFGIDSPPLVQKTININWNIPIRYDEGLDKLLNMTEFNRIQKIEDYVNQINSYYGNILKLEYNNYYAINVGSCGGLSSRTMFWRINGRQILSTERMLNWDWYPTGLKSPTNETWNDTYSPKGSVVSGNSYVMLGSRTSKPNSYIYYVDYQYGTESRANAINVSYVLNLSLTFNEEYLQRFITGPVNYTNLYFYVKENMRWRFLNTLTTRNNDKNQLRTSKSMFQSKTPVQLILISDNFIIINNKIVLNKLITADDLNIINRTQVGIIEGQSENAGVKKVTSNTVGTVNTFNSENSVKTVFKASWKLTQPYNIKTTEGHIVYGSAEEVLYGGTVIPGVQEVNETSDTVNDSYSNTFIIDRTTNETMKNSIQQNLKIFGNKAPGIPITSNAYGGNYNYDKLMKETLYIEGKFKVPYDVEFNLDYYPYMKITIKNIPLPYTEKEYYTNTYTINTKISDDPEIRINISYKDIYQVNFQPGSLVFTFDIGGIIYNLTLNSAVRTLYIPLPTPNNYLIYELKSMIDLDKYSFISENTDSTQNIALGHIDKILIFDKDNFKSNIQIKDKFGKIYIKNESIYNSIPEKGLILKYKPTSNYPGSLVELKYITPNQALASYPSRFYTNNNFIYDRDIFQLNGTQFVDKKYSENDLIPVIVNSLNWNEIEGKQLYQEYKYENFGKTFSIFKDRYAVIGTTEGKVVLKHLNDKTASEAIINCGNVAYDKFGSVLRSGKYIYINSPQQNKMFLVENVPYYE